jgi:hypothetical protein
MEQTPDSVNWISMVIDVLNLVVLALTLGVVAFYTIVTYRIQKIASEQAKELIHQRKLSIMPALVADVNARTDQFELANIGNGIAINIKIERVNIPFEALSGSYEFDRVLKLAPKESVSVPYEMYFDGSNMSGLKSLIHIREGQAKGRVVVKVSFQDIEGNRYTQTFGMGKGDYEYGFVEALTGEQEQESNLLKRAI